MSTVADCLNSQTSLASNEKKKIYAFLTEDVMKKEIKDYTAIKDTINKTISSHVTDTRIATNLWDWVSNNFAYKTQECPGLADVVYVTTILTAANGDVVKLKQFYGDENFPTLGMLLGKAQLINDKMGKVSGNIKKLHIGGRRMKGNTRRMGKGKKNKTYRKKYMKRSTGTKSKRE